MTTALIFISVVCFILAIVFTTAIGDTKGGVLFIGSLILLTIVSAIGATFSATYVKPFKGVATVVSLDHHDGYRSGGVKHRRYVPQCYSVVIKTNNELRSLCVPHSQWKDLKLDSTVEIGYDKKRHKYWGSYIVGENEPLRSSNGNFKQLCEVVDRKMVCDTVSENEYNKRFSEDAIKEIQQEGFRERQQEQTKRVKEMFGYE